MKPRRRTRQVKVGSIAIGGDAPVSVQTMTTGYTHEVDQTVQEIRTLVQAGADMVRVAVPDKKDTEALPAILDQVPCPIIADVHFHYQRAMEAIEAGVHKIRLNPGNIQDREQVNRVIDACRERNIPIRVGANEGGIVERRDKDLRATQKSELDTDYRGSLIRLMVSRIEEYLKIFEARQFHDVVISAKSIDPTIVIDAYRAISERFEYPLHLGVTHAGVPDTGRIRSVVALGSLLADGIGDTLRISYAADSVSEVDDGKELLCSLNLRTRSEPELIACPTCGRIEIDLIKLIGEVRRRLASIDVPVKVAVMGCVVNGPGEAEGADVAIFAGRGKGIIYVQGEQTRTVQEEDILEALYEESLAFANRVKAGEAKLNRGDVNIRPPDPLPRRDGSIPLAIAKP